jgi:hypothetical protein
MLSAFLELERIMHELAVSALLGGNSDSDQFPQMGLATFLRLLALTLCFRRRIRQSLAAHQSPDATASEWSVHSFGF